MAKTKIKASTQQHLDIEDIIDDLVVFKSGWVALVMTTTSVNFDLLSEAEQDSTIYSYGAFLNSLTFPVETLIRSKKADITAYFNHLADSEASQQNPDLKAQISKYRDFLQGIVQQKTVLDKSFYLIINFSPLEAGLKFLGKKTTAQKSKIQLLEEAKAALYPKRDHIMKQMGRLGLSVIQLTTKELIELYYDIYNPAPTGTQRVILDTSSYTVPIVEPAVESPIQAPALQTHVPQTQGGLVHPPLVVQQPVQTPTIAAVQQQVATQQPNNLTTQQPNLRPVPNQPYIQGQTPQADTATNPVVSAPQPQPATQSAYNAPSQPSQPSQPSVSSQPSQQEVLRKLQEATAKAAQLVAQMPTSPSVPDNPTIQLPNNPPTYQK